MFSVLMTSLRDKPLDIVMRILTEITAGTYRVQNPLTVVRFVILFSRTKFYNFPFYF